MKHKGVQWRFASNTIEAESGREGVQVVVPPRVHIGAAGQQGCYYFVPSTRGSLGGVEVKCLRFDPHDAPCNGVSPSP